jgi:esterase/lipase superfamily enzyme
VLGLSARLVNKRERLGSTSDTNLLTSLGISVVDLTVLSGQGSNDHLLAASSPIAIAIGTGLRQIGPKLGERGPTVIDAADVLVREVVGVYQAP